MSTSTHAAPPPRLARGGKYLTFLLEGEEYGIEILKVREIIGMLPVTRVPRTPAFVRGVANLRGKVIPIVDLRERFGMPRQDTAESCIVVAQVGGVPLGVVVDRVSEVLTIGDADIEPTPDFGAHVETGLLIGLATGSGRVRILLDIDQVLTATEAEAMRAAERTGH
ncbi:MAG: chemotaxis protein CheW [Gemmatimonadaceae bacterium]